ncbi:uncharacterized protein N7496_003104 [Penicillium cataractarum]|uniref:Pectinesterase n=1 Tax=Penicillium cataractarum TaxID=2100454 RepID=A0A9W9SLC0_9EURO|nr:uncharacterized protein N7496_003104 [Penicillium cataractarum]KAJ5380676.1 hypothetical protein N7496_003104 [Penicillium cataractarum]
MLIKHEDCVDIVSGRAGGGGSRCIGNLFEHATAPAVTVAPDGSGQFTAIGDAISYAQGKDIPTVTVLSGTYPAITIESTPSVTIVAETKNEYDYTQNEVVVSSDGTALTISANLAGLTVKNVKFVNTGSSGSAAILKGTDLGFYQCQFISSGDSAISANQVLAVIANSYIEAPTNLIEGSGDIYIFNTVIVPTGSSAVVVYVEGPTSNGKSTVAIDRSRVSQKPGVNNDNVYLAAAAGPGAVVVYRDSALGALIAPSGVKIDSRTQNDANLFGEYDTTGAGAYLNNQDARSGFVSYLETSSLSSVSISAIVADGNSDTTWIDPADQHLQGQGTAQAMTAMIQVLARQAQDQLALDQRAQTMVLALTRQGQAHQAQAMVQEHRVLIQVVVLDQQDLARQGQDQRAQGQQGQDRQAQGRQAQGRQAQAMVLAQGRQVLAMIQAQHQQAQGLAVVVLDQQDLARQAQDRQARDRQGQGQGQQGQGQQGRDRLAPGLAKILDLARQAQVRQVRDQQARGQQAQAMIRAHRVLTQALQALDHRAGAEAVEPQTQAQGRALVEDPDHLAMRDLDLGVEEQMAPTLTRAQQRFQPPRPPVTSTTVIIVVLDLGITTTVPQSTVTVTQFITTTVKQGLLLTPSTTDAIVTSLVGNATVTKSLDVTTIVSSFTSTQTDTKIVTTTLSCIPESKPIKRGLLKPRSTTASTTSTHRSTVTDYVTTSTITVPRSTKYITITRTTTINNPPKSKKESPLIAEDTSTPKTTTRTTEVTIHPAPTTTVITEWITSTESGIPSELRTTVTHTRTPSVTITSQITFTSTKIIKTISTTSTTITQTVSNAPTCKT